MTSKTYNTACRCPLLICKEQPFANQTPTLNFRENKNLYLPLKSDIKLEFTTYAELIFVTRQLMWAQYTLVSSSMVFVSWRLPVHCLGRYSLSALLNLFSYKLLLCPPFWIWCWKMLCKSILHAQRKTPKCRTQYFLERAEFMEKKFFQRTEETDNSSNHIQ